MANEAASEQQPSDTAPARLGLAAAQVEPVTIGDLARAVLRRDLSILLAHHVGILAGADADGVHDMRVTTRRLRAALRVFIDAFEEQSRALGEELGWLTGALGAVRDLDVQLAALARWQCRLPGAHADGLDEVIGLLSRQRADKLNELLGALGSERYDALVRALGRLAGDPGQLGPGAAVPAAVTLPDRILSAHRRAGAALRRARRRGRAEDLHRLRIRCKKLRYSIELASDLYPGTAPAAVARITQVQDRLGALQDDVVLAARIRSLAGADVPVLSPRARSAIEELADRLQRRVDRRLRRLPDRLGGIAGRSWHALRGDMRDGARRARSEVGSGPPASR